MANAQITTSVSIISSGLKGYQAVSLTNFTGSAECAIAAGSAIEVGNAFFLFSTDEAIDDFASITTAATCYVALTPTGSAGSQVLTAAWTETAPVWRDDNQGWYGSAASGVRCVGKALKTSTAGCETKTILEHRQEDVNNVGIRCKIIEIGDWVPTSGSGFFITWASAGVLYESVKSIVGVIRNDDDTYRYPLHIGSQKEDDDMVPSLDYFRKTLGIHLDSGHHSVFCSSANFDSTSYNRGWITIWYTA